MSLQVPRAGLGRTIATRPALLSIARLFVLAITRLPLIQAAPIGFTVLEAAGTPSPKKPNDPRLWIYLVIAVFLVLMGGVFAGLTIATSFPGQDDVNLRVIHESGEGKEKANAGSVLKLLKRGKHWVLVTLLLGNVITNETLPIVLDRSLGGGWPAVLSSTVLIGRLNVTLGEIIFGEIIPQSICVRYGLPIGAWMTPLVLGLMYVLGPVAWPTAKLLDRLLGEDHGTVYKKAGLKTLVTLHKTLGTSASERLNEDEVTIISAVLDLKDKPVGSIMTPMDDTFIMSGDTVLDEKMMNIILSAGYSRIPIHSPDNDRNFIGMLLVKTLITYDPEDCKRVSDFALATLPETRPETSCLDIVNFFQEGKSHMVLVSEHPGENHGALGVVTLEDVIEELIGEEIIDESDVYVDVHNAIKRTTPAPKVRIPRMQVISRGDKVKKADEGILIEIDEDGKAHDGQDDSKKARITSSESEHGTSPRVVESMRAPSNSSRTRPTGKRLSTGDLRQPPMHLGPSNLASKPRQTRYNKVKIKDLAGRASEDSQDTHRRDSEGGSTHNIVIPANGSLGSGLMSSAGQEAKDGTLALQPGYGTYGTMNTTTTSYGGEAVNKAIQAVNSEASYQSPEVIVVKGDSGHKSASPSRPTSSGSHGSQTKRSGSHSPKTVVIGVRSGSITENIVEAGGVRKVVLETTSSSEDTAEASSSGSQPDGNRGGEKNGAADEDDKGKENETKAGTSNNKKKRRRKRRKASGESDKSKEDAPLLGGEN
ncbi:MAG: hypothetical protein M1816_004482 [Peltula sp. TS41687]|nr:MAG: hypothetical protein M1816_004482 [Peltula sp. TS41687]